MLFVVAALALATLSSGDPGLDQQAYGSGGYDGWYGGGGEFQSNGTGRGVGHGGGSGDGGTRTQM